MQLVAAVGLVVTGAIITVDARVANTEIVYLSVTLGLASLLVARLLVRQARELGRTRRFVATLEPLVASLDATGQAMAARLHAPAARGADGEADLAGGLTHVQGVLDVVAAAQEQALVAPVPQTFVELAQRSQALLDAQLHALDSLEASEPDAARLEELFRLDHLAAQMRRVNECSLLLAGAALDRTGLGPLPLVSVVQQGVAETAHMSQVQLDVRPDLSVAGHAAADVAHLLAELIDLSGGARGADVLMVQSRTEGNDLQLVVSNPAWPIDADGLAEANRMLTEPLSPRLAPSAGLLAVATLADRHGLGVTFTAREAGGAEAAIALPGALVAPTMAGATARFTAEAVPPAPLVPTPSPTSSSPASPATSTPATSTRFTSTLRGAGAR